jgi:Tfp pilus assembly protein PilV
MHGSHCQHRRRSEMGFTLVEVTVAAFVMVVGLLGTIAMLDNANLTTASTKAREQGVALQRELIEAARSIPYDDLVPNSVVPAIQAHSDLRDEMAGTPGWQIRRRGVTYTVSVGACSVDDVADGQGTADDATFCPSGGRTSAATCRNLLGANTNIQGITGAAAAGLAVGDCGLDLNLDGEVDELTRAGLSGHVDLCALGLCPTTVTDTQPDDYKRIVTLVTWDKGTGRRYALQATTVPNPGSAAAPQVNNVTAASLNVTTQTHVAFSALTSRAAATVAWSVNGSAQGTANYVANTWSWDWDIGAVGDTTPNADEVPDGVYVVGAKAFDPYGVSGETRSVTVSINRRAPYAPDGFTGGRDSGGSGGSDTVDFEWSAGTARDIVGYRVYRQPAAGNAVQVCPATAGATTTATSCQATSQPGDALLTYFVVAVDHDTVGNLREGAVSTPHVVTLTNTAPAPPGTLTATESDGHTVLSWGASAGDTDPGDSVDFYRIYRDGTVYTDRYDRTGTGSELTYTDTHTDGVAHLYRVVAVDTQLAESAFSNGASA